MDWILFGKLQGYFHMQFIFNSQETVSNTICAVLFKIVFFIAQVLVLLGIFLYSLHLQVY